MITSIAFIFVAATFRYVAFIFQRRRLGTNGFWTIIAIGSLAIIVTFTLARLGVRSHEIRQLVLVPFAGGEYANVNSRMALVKVFGNIALFAPLGFSLQYMFRWRIMFTTLCGFIVSVVVESLQFWLARGTSTTGDLILNSLGVSLGALIAIKVFNRGTSSRVDV